MQGRQKVVTRNSLTTKRPPVLAGKRGSTMTDISPTLPLTSDEFIRREILVWGEDYILDLIDRGFTPVLVSDGVGVKWTWVYGG